MTLHFSQIGFTDALTFILNLHFYRPPHPRNPARILIRSPFRSVLTDLLPKRPLPIVAWKFNTCNHFEAKKHQFFRVFLPFFYKKVPACDGSHKQQNPFHRLCILAERFYFIGCIFLWDKKQGQTIFVRPCSDSGFHAVIRQPCHPKLQISRIWFRLFRSAPAQPLPLPEPKFPAYCRFRHA